MKLGQRRKKNAIDRKCECPIRTCDCAYEEMKLVKRHFHIKHKDQLPNYPEMLVVKREWERETSTKFQCDEPGCTKSYQHKPNLNQHMKNEHGRYIKQVHRITQKLISKKRTKKAKQIDDDEYVPPIFRKHNGKKRTKKAKQIDDDEYVPPIFRKHNGKKRTKKAKQIDDDEYVPSIFRKHNGRTKIKKTKKLDSELKNNNLSDDYLLYLATVIEEL